MGLMIPTKEIEAEQQFDVIAGEIRNAAFQAKIKDALNSGWKPAGSALQDGGFFCIALTRFVDKNGEPIPTRMGLGLMGGIGGGAFG
jgi:hypothetical protein